MGAFQAQGSSVRHGLNLFPMWAGDPHWHAVTVLRLKELQVEDDGAARVAKTHGPAIPLSPLLLFSYVQTAGTSRFTWTHATGVVQDLSGPCPR